MTSWVAISYGALDISEWHENGTETEIMLVSSLPTEPFGIFGEAATLWRRLVAGPVAETDLNECELETVREFADVGIASQDPDHPARIRTLDAPWFSSPLHELVCSITSSIARDHGINMLVFKGPVLHRQGLRTREHSGDVDIWVDPQHIDRFTAACTDWGWTLWPDIWNGTTVNHSVTLIPGEWGCEIDVHRNMPGSALRDADLFDRLLEQSDTLMFAGVGTRVPDRTAHAVVSGMHLLRPHRSRDVNPVALTMSTELFEKVGPDVIQVSELFRTHAALEPALRQAFPDEEFVIDHVLPQNWVWRTHRFRVFGYLSALKLLPLKERFRFIGRLIWPTQEMVDATNVRAGITDKFGFGARLVRWKRAFSRT